MITASSSVVACVIVVVDCWREDLREIGNRGIQILEPIENLISLLLRCGTEVIADNVNYHLKKKKKVN